MMMATYDLQERPAATPPWTTAQLYRLASEAMLERDGVMAAENAAEFRRLLQAMFFEAHVSQRRTIGEAHLERAVVVSGASPEVAAEFRRRVTSETLPLLSLPLYRYQTAELHFATLG